MTYPTTAAVRQGCTRSVVLSSHCLVTVICSEGKTSDTKHVDVNVRMGWYINYYQKGSYITSEVGAIAPCYGHAHAAAAYSRTMEYGGVANGTLRSKQSATTTAATRA